MKASLNSSELATEIGFKPACLLIAGYKLTAINASMLASDSDVLTDDKQGFHYVGEVLQCMKSGERIDFPKMAEWSIRPKVTQIRNILLQNGSNLFPQIYLVTI